MNINDPTRLLARLAIYLQAYEFEIIHRKEFTIHSNADTLSRPVMTVQRKFFTENFFCDLENGFFLHSNKIMN